MSESPESQTTQFHTWMTMWMTDDEITQANNGSMRVLIKLERFMQFACEISARLGMAPTIDLPYAMWLDHQITLTHNERSTPRHHLEIRLDRAGGPDAATRKVAEYVREQGLGLRVMNGNDEVPVADFLKDDR
jgi:hypothetical protein